MQTVLELLILWHQPPECWDFRCIPPHLGNEGCLEKYKIRQKYYLMNFRQWINKFLAIYIISNVVLEVGCWRIKYIVKQFKWQSKDLPA